MTELIHGESEIRKAIAGYLKTIPGCRITCHTKPRGKYVSSSWPPKGWPDISGSLNGRGLFIEVKTPTGKVYQEQIKFIDDARVEGNIAFFATSVSEVKRILSQCGTEIHTDNPKLTKENTND